MGTTNLPNITAPVVTQTHNNDIRAALRGTLYGKNSSSGATQAGEDLGSIAIPWGNLYAAGLIIGGQPVNLDLIETAQNRIVSGQTRTTSGQPDFLRADGTVLTAVIEGAITNLVLTIDGTQVTFSTDVSVTSLTAAPSSNNTALVNETTYSGQNFTKYAGESKNTLNIDNAGSEWTSRIGEMIAFKVGATSEIAFGYLKSATEITQCYRGYFFDSSGSPLVRQPISNNDTLTLLSLGWVYGNNTGTTASVGYTTPVFSSVEPSSPSLSDYWFDVVNENWLVYNGSVYVDANSTLIGVVANDTSACIGTRSFDFDVGLKDTNNVDLLVETTERVRIKNLDATVSVYGNDYYLGKKPLFWDITTDRETGVAETADTTYFIYLTEDCAPVISDVKPYDRRDLLGYYHPYNTWRYLGTIRNDNSSDIFDAKSIVGTPSIHILESTTKFLFTTGVNYRITVIGGGAAGTISGGGDSGSASIYYSGYLSQFLEYETCTVAASTNSSVGNTSSLGTFITAPFGTAIGGDINYNSNSSPFGSDCGGNCDTEWGGNGGYGDSAVTPQPGQKYGGGGGNGTGSLADKAGAQGVIVIEEYI